MARGWRPPRKRRRSLLFENDAAHSSSTTARRSNLVDYSRDEKKTEREAKTRRREKEAEESMKGNAEGEREMRRWTREDQRWKVPLYIHTKCRSSVFQIISERRKKNVRYFIRFSCFYNLKIANVTQEIGHVFEKNDGARLLCYSMIKRRLRYVTLFVKLELLDCDISYAAIWWWDANNEETVNGSKDL